MRRHPRILLLILCGAGALARGFLTRPQDATKLARLFRAGNRSRAKRLPRCRRRCTLGWLLVSRKATTDISPARPGSPPSETWWGGGQCRDQSSREARSSWVSAACNTTNKGCPIQAILWLEWENGLSTINREAFGVSNPSSREATPELSRGRKSPDQQSRKARSSLPQAKCSNSIRLR